MSAAMQPPDAERRSSRRSTGHRFVGPVHARSLVPGIYRARDLLASGIEPHEALRAGMVQRLRRGWYADGTAPPDLTSAVARAAALSCLSALRFYGVWVPPLDRVHVRQMRRGPGHHCFPYGRKLWNPGPIDPPAVAVSAAARCVDPDMLIVLCDSLVHRGIMSAADVRTALASAPLKVRDNLARMDHAESGTETLVRLRLRAKRVEVRPQVLVPQVGWVDFLIGRRLVLEVDSRTFHDREDSYVRDRERDRKLAALGYLVVRLTYQQVMYQWEEVAPDIWAIIRAREHRREPLVPPSPRSRYPPLW